MPGTLTRKPIRDFSWMVQLRSGRIRERFTHSGLRVVAIELLPSSNSPYKYRMLFFQPTGQKPILSVNLETSILGSSCLTGHVGERHMNLGHLEASISYEEFRAFALDEAARLLA